MAGIRAFTGGAVIVLGGGKGPFPSVPTGPEDQPAEDASQTMPQVFGVQATYDGPPNTEFGVNADEIE